MKKNIHPNIFNIDVICSCNNIIKIKSTSNSNINIDTCNLCHPFYTNKNRIIYNIGKIGKFNNKFKDFFE
ncbi:50S ribosomal protein L31 [endosymbiont of Pachyrhynchus infernalis]|uniref:50S ribosomal protein L31 n=1 Tax=endosymbiont of Pachyrhynchus infernalis TaxID=1971488 RepID=UPI000DC7225A|nr:50S ribosomal protein L31 [endosymbiont of Pachyrhynchus infernalis]BBA84945.1 50S ribosomal protein L31 [endosymbiont of Pachyrhynchus infernalis]